MSQDLNKVKSELQDELSKLNNVGVDVYKTELKKAREEAKSIDWSQYK